MYSGADTSLPLDPGCLHHLLRKVGDHDTIVKAQETSIRMLQDRLTRMGHSVVELTQSNAKRALPPMHRPDRGCARRHMVRAGRKSTAP